MEGKKLNIIEELCTKEIILGYLMGVFEDNPSKERILRALDTAIKAVNAHSLQDVPSQ